MDAVQLGHDLHGQFTASSTPTLRRMLSTFTGKLIEWYRRANTVIPRTLEMAAILTLDELLAFLRQTIQAGESICPGLRYDFYAQRDRYSALLYYAILDHARSIAALADAKTYSAIPIVTRSALDAYADIANLADHVKYWEHMEEADASKWKPLLERASRGGNPALRGLAESDLLPQGRRQFSKDLKELRARGVSTLGAEERFQRAGLITNTSRCTRF